MPQKRSPTLNQPNKIDEHQNLLNARCTPIKNHWIK